MKRSRLGPAWPQACHLCSAIMLPFISSGLRLLAQSQSPRDLLFMPERHACSPHRTAPQQFRSRLQLQDTVNSCLTTNLR